MSVRPFLVLLVSMLTTLLIPAARAQTLPADLEFSVLTFGPGPVVYERFGHVGIRVSAPSRSLDVTYDWGNFSFDDPNFFSRFVRGDNRYWMQGKSTREMLDVYIGEWDRTVTEQRLALTGDQKLALLKELERQDTEANRFYVYDYYRDNCGTRVRDAIDVAIDGQLRPQLGAMTAHGYRWQTERMLWCGADNKTLATLIDFLGGPRIDRPLSEWDVAFLPAELSHSLDRATIANDDGTRRPLVDRRAILNATTRPGNVEPIAPGFVVTWPLLIGLCGASALATTARWCWPICVTLIAAWESFAAFGGTLLCFMSVFTRHWAVAWNENLLQFTPIGLIVIVSIVSRRWRRTRLQASAVAAALSAIGALLAISHLTPQHAAPAIALALPMHLAVWHAVRSRESRRTLVPAHTLVPC